MHVSNNLVEESFGFTEEKVSMLQRSEEIGALEEIAFYCDSIDEKIKYTDKLWSIGVEEGVSFLDYLYMRKGQIREDDRRRLEEMISKKMEYASEEDDDERILVSLGEYCDCKANMQEYIAHRRFLLSNITDVHEYEDFMYSCFPHSLFAKNILSEMRNIKNFSINVKEITKCLSVLDDDAIDLYREYHSNLKIAMDILTAKLRECAPDPDNVDKLMFPFIYEEQENGENVVKEKEIECSPHLKLIHPGSNLRIYFFWCDKDVGNGEKVLIGRIGRHPY